MKRQLDNRRGDLRSLYAPAAARNGSLAALGKFWQQQWITFAARPNTSACQFQKAVPLGTSALSTNADLPLRRQFKLSERFLDKTLLGALVR